MMMWMPVLGVPKRNGTEFELQMKSASAAARACPDISGEAAQVAVTLLVAHCSSPRHRSCHEPFTLFPTPQPPPHPTPCPHEKLFQQPLNILKSNPYQSYPVYEKLSGDLASYYSRRINIQHRLVDQVIPEEKVVKIIRMWTHYE